MPDKFQNKYRILSARAAWWNYNSIASYFITICTKKREHFFGQIVVGTPSVETPCVASPLSGSQTPCMASLQATEIGKIAEQEWLKTPSVRPDMNLELDEFVIMPNHFHAIIHISENKYNRALGRDAMHGVSTDLIPSGNKFGPQSKNLSSIVRGYKSAITTYAGKNNIEFAWQSRFHDHIIRNEQSYQRIKHYIMNNLNSWKDDKFYNS